MKTSKDGWVKTGPHEYRKIDEEKIAQELQGNAKVRKSFDVSINAAIRLRKFSALLNKSEAKILNEALESYLNKSHFAKK